MSFVLFAGCRYFGIMLGDKRSCDSNGDVISENIEKVKKINDNLIFAGAGDEDIINLTHEYLYKNNQYNQLTFDVTLNLLKDNYCLLYQKLLELAKNQCVERSTEVSANSGITSIINNIISFASITLYNDTIKIVPKYLSTDNDIIICYLGVGLGNLGKCFENKFKDTNIFSINNLKATFQKTLNDNVKNDFSINNKILYETIVRSDIYDERNDRPL